MMKVIDYAQHHGVQPAMQGRSNLDKYIISYTVDDEDQISPEL